MLLSLRRLSEGIGRDFFLFAVNKTIYTIPGVLLVIQIVSKKSVIIIPFTQHSKRRNFISIEFIFCKIPLLKRELFTLIDFLRSVVIQGLENCFCLRFERVLRGACFSTSPDKVL